MLKYTGSCVIELSSTCHTAYRAKALQNTSVVCIAYRNIVDNISNYRSNSLLQIDIERMVLDKSIGLVYHGWA
jgi:hypothetical protein